MGLQPSNPADAGFADLRLAIISPFLDRRHGTERCILEQLERIAAQHGAEIHLYCQRVEDLPGVTRYPSTYTSGRILWHKVPGLPGPHLVAYVWWFLANHLQRLWDSSIRGLKFDVLYSPGINALDADVIAVHIVFHEFYVRVRTHLGFRGTPIATWPILAHRRLYYRLIRALERRVYRRPETSLTAVSGLVAGQLAEYFHREDICVIRNGVDTNVLSPPCRLARRASAREQLCLCPGDFTLLFIGNDWKKKGLDTLLEAFTMCPELPLRLLVVGSDDRKRYEPTIQESGIVDRISFLNLSPDVLQFYAAADAYVSPSREDAYGLPILEAMACGLPVVASSRAGASEIIDDGRDGLLLRNPEDHQELAGLVRTLCLNPGMCRQIGKEAYLTAQRHTWDRNAAELWEVLKVAAKKKKS